MKYAIYCVGIIEKARTLHGSKLKKNGCGALAQPQTKGRTMTF